MSISDYINACLLIVAIITTAFTGWQVRESRLQNSSSQASERRSRRPYMIAKIESPKGPKHPISMLVKNIGLTSAVDVKITFDPPLPMANLEELKSNAELGVDVYMSTIDILNSVFENTYATWVPGHEVRCVYWLKRRAVGLDQHMGIDIRKSPEEETQSTLNRKRLSLSADGICATTKAVISYGDDDGNLYSESYDLNPQIWLGIYFSKDD